MRDYKSKITEEESRNLKLFLEEQEEEQKIQNDELDYSSEDLLPKTIDCEEMIR